MDRKTLMHLPQDALAAIASHLPLKSLLSFAQTCKLARQVMLLQVLLSIWIYMQHEYCFEIKNQKSLQSELSLSTSGLNNSEIKRHSCDASSAQTIRNAYNTSARLQVALQDLQFQTRLMNHYNICIQACSGSVPHIMPAEGYE